MTWRTRRMRLTSTSPTSRKRQFGSSCRRPPPLTGSKLCHSWEQFASATRRCRRQLTMLAMSLATRVDDAAVVDASALVDFLLGTDRGRAVGPVLGRFAALHAPAHIDAEVLSALGRLHRAGTITAP